jgi:hypothetical protein
MLWYIMFVSIYKWGPILQILLFSRTHAPQSTRLKTVPSKSPRTPTSILSGLSHSIQLCEISVQLSMLVNKNSPSRRDLSAILQHPSLFGHLTQLTQYLLIAFHKPVDCIRDLDFLAELPY